jgi:type I restriction enzyme, S subunit
MSKAKTQQENWQRTRLGDLFKIKHGYAFKSKYFSDSGNYIVLTPGNFTERDGLVIRNGKEKYYNAKPPEEYILNKGDLLIVMTDLKQSAPYLGAPGVVPERRRFLHNQRLGLI